MDSVRNERRLPWWLGLLVVGLLIGLSEGLDHLNASLAAREFDVVYSFWISLGALLVFDLAAIAGVAILHRLLRPPRWLAALLIAAGAYVWFLAFCEVGPLQAVGPWAQGFVVWGDRLLLGHPYTVSLLTFYFFLGIVLLFRRRRHRLHESLSETHPWIATSLWLFGFIGASFLTTRLSPISLVSAGGVFGNMRPRWFAQNLGEIRTFVLDAVVVLSWLAVGRAVIRNRRSALPWIGCGLAVLVLAILPEIVGASSFAFRQFFSRINFWFGSTASAATTMLSIGILALALRTQRRPRKADDALDAAGSKGNAESSAGEQTDGNVNDSGPRGERRAADVDVHEVDRGELPRQIGGSE